VDVAVGSTVSVGEGMDVAAIVLASATPVAILSGVAVGGKVASGDTLHAALARKNNGNNQNI
jgi:hypothetical protein